MWPEDEENDYSYMAAKKKHEELAQMKQKDKESQAAQVMLGYLLKNIG